VGRRYVHRLEVGKALGVPKFNEGTRQVKRDNFLGPAYLAARKRAWAKARDPERCAKIAVAKLGKPRPWHVIEAMRKANLGRKLSAAHRRKMSEAHKRRGTRPPKAGKPWSLWEDRLVQCLRPPQVAEKTGRTLPAVWRRRRQLGLPDGRVGRKVPR
jgi:Ni/Co efflux regulator RcnB